MREAPSARRLDVPGSTSDIDVRPVKRPRTRRQEKLQNGMISTHEEEAPPFGAQRSPSKSNLSNEVSIAQVGDQGDPQARPTVQERRPWSIDRMRAIISYHIAELRQDHGYFTRAWLRRARQERLHSNEISMGSTHSLSKPAESAKSISPFAEMKGKDVASSTKSIPIAGSSGKLTQEIVRGPNAKNDRKFISVPVTTYAANPMTVPNYTSYITLSSNILTEDDEQMRYWPYFGESEVENIESHKAISELFSNRIKEMPTLRLRAEQAAKFEECAKRFLSDVGCTGTDVLHFLLDKEKPIPDDSVPLDWETAWMNREDHLEENFNQDDEKEMKRWREVQRKLPYSSPTSIAVAGLACKAFLDATGFSLWHITKKDSLATDIESPRKTTLNTPITKTQARQARESDPYNLGTYADLGCLVCFAHECPGHGAFGDDTDVEDEEDATSNPRSRVHALFPLLAKTKDLIGKHHGGTPIPEKPSIISYDDLGLDDNGKIWGSAPIPVKETVGIGLADDQLCSPNCFWKKGNRAFATNLGWSESQLALLDAILPAYIYSKRCACMLAATLGKPCNDVYFRIRSKINANAQSSSASLVPGQHIRGRWSAKKGFEHWLENSKTWKHHERGSFKPCNHLGPCDKRGCPCYEAGITCEKACMCSGDCGRRFRGCSCARGNRPCWKNKKCDCYKLNRECDPDLCGTCGAADALDPVNRYNDQARQHSCNNIHIQRNVPKRTLLGHSAVAGWGLYMGEPAKAGDYLGEYKGEVISKDESERRGWVYDNRNISYLFDLNMNQVLDSTRAGNKFRYVNHQDKPDVNCEPRVLFCNMAHRIGMYATRDIQLGEELLFDYGYSGEAVKFVKVKLRKNGNASDSKDSSGNSSHPSRIILTVKKPGKRGGARAGAGRKPRALKAAAAAKAKGTMSNSNPAALGSPCTGFESSYSEVSASSASPALVLHGPGTLAGAPAGAKVRAKTSTRSAAAVTTAVLDTLRSSNTSRESSIAVGNKRKRSSGTSTLEMTHGDSKIPVIEIEDTPDDDEEEEDEEEDEEEVEEFEIKVDEGDSHDDDDDEEEEEEEEGEEEETEEDARREGEDDGEVPGEADEDYHNSANESDASSSAHSALHKSSRFRRSQRWKRARVD